jgi:phosphoserine aminotransferase
MARIFNFSAGPAMLPLPVLERAREELLDFAGCGMSVMEVSHRGAEFKDVAQRAEARLRELLAIPAEYRVLFLQGGAQLQFSAVPLNLLPEGAVADYADTGSWSAKAIAEARRYGRVNVVASPRTGGYGDIPDPATWERAAGAAYLHYTPNETIDGVEFHFIPDAAGVPLVADMSSTILSRPLEVSRFGLIYAGAQKNIGIAGLTVTIVHADLLGRARSCTPTLLDYAVQAESGSMANTAPTFAWYVAGLVFDWLAEQGGLEAMAGRNRRKAETLYDAIGTSNFYANPVAEHCRSWMNVPFTLADPGLDGTFLAEAKAAGLSGLKGHRSVGGMRASIYNAMPQEGVDALVEFMGDFERRHG